MYFVQLFNNTNPPYIVLISGYISTSCKKNKQAAIRNHLTCFIVTPIADGSFFGKRNSTRVAVNKGWCVSYKNKFQQKLNPKNKHVLTICLRQKSNIIYFFYTVAAFRALTLFLQAVIKKSAG